MTPKLEVRGLRKLYDEGSVAAVDGVSFTVHRGETVALLGPSGCGKSTTLNMIIGLEEPTEGEILVDGRSVVGVPPGKRNVGLVFQDYAVFTHMTVEGNIRFGLEVRGMPRAEVRRRVGEAAELLGLTPILKEKTAKLGGSELQRVAIARTLVTEPAILLLDEPLSNLEAEARQAMRQELRRLQKETGLTIIYVTHDQIEALSLADKVAVMSAGKIRQYGTTAAIYDDPGHVFVAGFIGSPPINLVRGRIAPRDGGPVFEAGAIALPVPPRFAALGSGGPMVLGVRPEAIRLGAGGLAAEVVLAAHRGPDTVVTLDVGGTELKALVPTVSAPQGGSTTVSVDRDALVLFSGETGLNVSSAAHLEAAA